MHLVAETHSPKPTQLVPIRQLSSKSKNCPTLVCSNQILTYMLSTQEATQQNLFGSKKRESLCLSVWRGEDKDEFILFHCLWNWPKENGDIHVHNLKAHNHHGSGWVSELDIYFASHKSCSQPKRQRQRQNELAFDTSFYSCNLTSSHSNVI